MTKLWRNWMTTWGWGVGAFGLLLTGGAFEATDGPTRAIYALVGAPDLELEPAFRFSIALLGAVTLGMALAVLSAARAAERLGEAGRPIWTRLTGAVVVWYLIDSALSVATGFPLNAVSNTLIFAGFLAPVLGSGVLGSPASAAQVGAPGRA